MSRAYDTPPPPTPLGCVKYKEYPDSDGNRRMMKRLLIFDCSKFTPAVMLGGDTKRWDKGAMHGQDLYAPLDTIPLGNFARWVFQEKQRYWRDNGIDADGVDPLVRAFVSDVLTSGNDFNMIGAINAEEGYVLARLPEDHPYGPNQAVELAVEVDEDHAGFVTWYREEDELLEQRKVEEECAALHDSQVGRSLRTFGAIRGAQHKTRTKLASTMAALSAGSVVLDIVETFARPAEERKALWPGHMKAGYNFAYPDPSPALRDANRVFHSEWDVELLGRVAAVVTNAEVKAEQENAAAQFVAGLRESGAPYLQMLSRYRELRPGSRAILRHTLLEGLKSCMLVRSAREDLGAHEFLALAELAAGHPTVDPPAPKDATPIEDGVRRAFASFDPSLLAPKDPTPLGKFAAEQISKANDWVEHGGMLLDMLALATPVIMKKAEKVSKNYAAAWLWKALVGTCELNQPQLERIWFDKSSYEDVTRTEEGLIRTLGKKAKPFWNFANIAAKTLHLYYALGEFEKAGKGESGLKGAELAQSFLQFASTIAGWGEDQIEAFLKAAGRADEAKSFTKIAPSIGLVADVIGYSIAVTKVRAVRKKGLRPKLTEGEELDMWLEFASLANSVLATVFDKKLLILAVVIAGAKVLLTTKDDWIPKIVPGLGEKCAPHRHLESILTTLQKEDEGYAKAKKEIKGVEMVDLDKSIYVVWDRLFTPPLETAQFLWGVSGPAGSDLGNAAKKIIREQWDGQIDDEAIERVVG